MKWLLITATGNEPHFLWKVLWNHTVAVSPHTSYCVILYVHCELEKSPLVFSMVFLCLLILVLLLSAIKVASHSASSTYSTQSKAHIGKYDQFFQKHCGPSQKYSHYFSCFHLIVWEFFIIYLHQHFSQKNSKFILLQKDIKLFLHSNNF